MAMIEKVRQKALELHLAVSSMRDETKKKCDIHFTWLEEILIEAKKSFSSPEVQLLPKTPCMKRTRQMRKNKNEDTAEEGNQAKRTRRTRKGKTDSGAESTDTGSQRSTRSTRATRATRATTTDPILNVQTEALNEDTGSESYSDVAKENQSPARRGMTPSTTSVAFAEATSQSPRSPRVVVANLSYGKSPAKKIVHASPKEIPGFTTLNVKEKASAYEDYVSSPQKKLSMSAPTRDSTASPRKNNVLCRVLDSLRKSNSPRTSPRSPTKKTPVGSPIKLGTPTKNLRTPRNKVSPAVHIVVNQASAEKAVPSPSTQQSKENDDEYEDVEEAKDALAVTRAPRRSSRRSSVKVVSKPLGVKTPLLKRKSSILKESFHKPSDKNLGRNSSIRRTPSKARKPTPAPITLGNTTSADEKSQSGPASSMDSEEMPSPAPPQPKARSKPRVPQSTDTSDDEMDGQKSPPKRTTRSKVRQNKPPPPRLPVTDEEANGDADGEDDEDETPNNEGPKTPTPAPRTTRSRMRLNKQAPPKLPAPSTDEDPDTPSHKRPRIVKPGSPSSGNKRPQALAGHSDVPPAKKRCKDDDADSQDSDDAFVDKTPSPPCPRHKVIRGQSNQPHAFLSQLKKTVSTPSNLSSTITSFIKRNTPVKSASQVREMQKRKDVEAKNKDVESRVNKRQELLQQKAEENRRRREERQALAAKRREEHQRRIQESQRETLRRQDENKDLKTKMLEEKQKEEREKQKARDKKLAEAETRRKQEEDARLQRLREAEAEAKKVEEMQLRKKEYEEAERQKKIAEQKKLEDERRLEAERERMKEVEKQRKESEEKQRQAAEERKQREEVFKRERYEREQRELEEKKERERVRMEELDKIREKERERLRQMVAKAQQEKETANNKNNNTSALQKNTSLMNASNTQPVRPNLNTTVTKEPNPDSYEITPTKPPKSSKKTNPENYDIQNIDSEDSTDDEDDPKKIIPSWALGANLKAALISQHYHPPSLDTIFADIAVPDLNLLFKRKKARFNKRTSSACWDSPMLKASGKSQSSSD